MNTFSKYQNLNVSSNVLPFLLFQHCAAFPLRQAHYWALLNGSLHVQPPCRGVAQLAASVLLCPQTPLRKTHSWLPMAQKRRLPLRRVEKPIFFSSPAQWPAFNPDQSRCFAEDAPLDTLIHETET